MRITTHTQPDIDQGFLPGRSAREPRLAKDLLEGLGAERASLDEQRSAVRAWLASHRPNRLLQDDLEESGLL